MNKLNLILISGFIILSSCITEKENRYLISGEDFGTKRSVFIIGCEYDGFDNKIMDSIIAQLGKDYTYTKTIIDETYEWNNVVIKEISNQAIYINVNTRIREVEFKDGEIHHLEHIELKISQDGKDFLHPLKFRNRHKTKKYLNNIE